jgi:hypothetical protein
MALRIRRLKDALFSMEEVLAEVMSGAAHAVLGTRGAQALGANMSVIFLTTPFGGPLRTGL